VPVLAVDYVPRLKDLAPVGAGEGSAILGKITDAQRLARTNVNPSMVGEVVRMALSGKG
jgi:hypothetical protein